LKEQGRVWWNTAASEKSTNDSGGMKKEVGGMKKERSNENSFQKCEEALIAMED
jgi:hypothetical protein